MTSNPLSFWLAALHLPQIGPQTILQCLTKIKDISTLFQSTPEELRAQGIPESIITLARHPNWQQVEQDLAWAEMPGNTIVHYNHPIYPPLLKEIHTPPLVLYIQGNPTILSNIQLAVVGSRSASVTGLENAYQFSNYLSSSGLTITSGLALGIDGAAHKGALAANSPTIAVMGTGLKHLYPASHRRLANDILAKGGAIISEFPLDTTPQAYNFPRRNRIISGLSVGVLVVEAAIKSGSLITAKLALEQGREVFAIPGSIHQTMAKGCHYLIRQGAKLVEGAKDILEELNMLSQAAAELKANQHNDLFNNLSVSEKELLLTVGYEMTSLDMIVLRSGLTLAEVSSILLALELQGCVQSIPGGYIRSTRYQ
ncbi:MAG: DNA-processing protein DprA [Gammaproteobacteria bacterium]